MTNLSEQIEAILAADGDTFEALAKIAGLDPRRDFRDCNLDGVDFAGSNLAGFDFSGSMLRNCRFEHAFLGDADFSGTQTDPGALQRATDWATSIAAKQAEYEKDWLDSDLRPGHSGIGDSIRSIQTVSGIENHLRYLINRYKMDPVAAILDAAAEAPIHESLAGAVAASGLTVRLSSEAEEDGQVALAELKSRLSRRDLRAIERAAATAPTFGLCFASISLLVRFDKVGPSNLDRASKLLEFSRRGDISKDAMDFAESTRKDARMFDWQLSGMNRAIILDRRAPSEYQMILLLFLAESPEQVLKAFRFMGEHQTYMSSDMIYALSKATIPEASGKIRRPKDILDGTIWRGYEDVSRHLFSIRDKWPDRRTVTPTQAFEVAGAMRSLSNRSWF